MKKLSTLFLCAMLALVSAHAELYLEENFNYPDGDLEQAVQAPLELHKWMCSLKAEDAKGVSPQVANHNLTYPGYIASGQGKVAVLDAAVGDDATTQRISVYYIDTLGARDTVSMYAAFLMKPLSAKNTAGRDIAIWEGSASKSQARGRLFMIKSGSNVKLGIAKNNSSATSAYSQELTTGSVNLVVMKYEYLPGPKNDVVKVWVNPSLNKSEDENAALVCSASDISGQTDMIVRGFGLRQRGNGVEIGGLRIASTWAEAVKTDGSDIPDQPEVDTDVYAVEDFVYDVESELEGQGGWVVSTKADEQGGKSPKIGAESLSYEGYFAGAEGGALVLDSVAQEISGSLKRTTAMPFVSDKLAEDDVVYTALLVNMSNMNSTSGKDLFAYMKQGTEAAPSTTMRGRVVVKIEEGMKSFAIRKNSQTIENWSAATPKEETALLVVKYINKSTSSGGAADEFYLYVNPDPSKSEAENAVMEAVGNDADGGSDLRYICFRQMKLNATVDGICVAKTWEKVLNGPSQDKEEAVENIKAEADKTQVILRNGQLLILRGEAVYSITGQRIQ